MTFLNENFEIYMDVMIAGISSGFTLGFLAWAIGFGIYGIIHLIKMA